MPPRYVSGVKTNIGTVERSSNLLANTPLINPVNDKNAEERITIKIVSDQLYTDNLLKNKDNTETKVPTNIPRVMPPLI